MHWMGVRSSHTTIGQTRSARVFTAGNKFLTIHFLRVNLTEQHRLVLHLVCKHRLFHHRNPTSITARIDIRHLLSLHKRKTPILLLEPHHSKANHNKNPVEVVRQDRTISRRVRPAEQRIEDPPTTSSIDLRRTAVDVPDTLSNIVRSRTGSCLAGVASDGVVPGVVLEEPDCA
jgi:hypothetical protein